MRTLHFPGAAAHRLTFSNAPIRLLRLRGPGSSARMARAFPFPSWVPAPFSAYAVNRAGPLKTSFAELRFERHLKLLHIRRGRIVPRLLRYQTQSSCLIQVPFRLITIAERNFSTYHGASPRKMIHRDRNAA